MEMLLRLSLEDHIHILACVDESANFWQALIRPYNGRVLKDNGCEAFVVIEVDQPNPPDFGAGIKTVRLERFRDEAERAAAAQQEAVTTYISLVCGRE